MKKTLNNKSIKNLEIDNLSINTMRFLAIDMINKANSGHPGIALGSAPAIYTLFTKNLNINAKTPKWINRDRFVLSAGHGSSILYAILHLLDYSLTLDDLKNFRQLNSLTPGHPEVNITKGVDATTGPLGQGLAMALGMAIAENYLAKQFNKPGLKIIDHYTYSLCGDGCLQEGISQEMLSLAGKLGLKKLIVLFDSNDVQLDSYTKICTKENIKKRVESAGWKYLKVEDGNNVFEINQAINQAKKNNSPTFIEIKTIIGYGSPKQASSAVHGAPLGIENTKITKTNLHWNYQDSFFIPNDVKINFSKIIKNQNLKYQAWEKILIKYKQKYLNQWKLLSQAISYEYAINWDNIYKNIEKKEVDSIRNISSLVLKAINEEISQNILIGSADLSASTKIKGFNGIYEPNNKNLGNNIMYGVREFCMGAVANGIALHQGLQTYCSTFMTFSDYLKPALRLASLMDINPGYIFSHDSIMVGEDGPTHQPIEQLTMLQSIPNNYVFKPCNYLETILAFKFNFLNHDKSFTLITTRQDYLIPNNLSNKTDDILKNGAYIISSNTNSKYITILASGYEVFLALEVKKLLKNKLDIRIVSVPCLKIFLKLPREKQYLIIGQPVKKVVIELADGIYWNSLLNANDLLININQFGKSGKDKDVLKNYGFDPESLKKAILK